MSRPDRWNSERAAVEGLWEGSEWSLGVDCCLGNRERKNYELARTKEGREAAGSRALVSLTEYQGTNKPGRRGTVGRIIPTTPIPMTKSRRDATSNTPRSQAFWSGGHECLKTSEGFQLARDASCMAWVGGKMGLPTSIRDKVV